MGLKSLPLLNKSGISMYWNNVWDSITLYKKYSLSFLYLNDVIRYFLNENLYYYCITKIRAIFIQFRGIKSRKKVKNNKIKRLKNMKNFYLGKILFFNNQGWVVVVINYFMSRRNKLFMKYKKTKNFKKLFKIFRFNFEQSISNLDKYKFKF